MAGCDSWSPRRALTKRGLIQRLYCDSTLYFSLPLYCGQTLMCGNRLTSFKQFETVLTHELLHAFDHCRAEVDPFDLRHHACMEVRAASLSGDCEFKREASIGNLNMTKQHPVSRINEPQQQMNRG